MAKVYSYILAREGPFCSICGLYMVSKDRTEDHIIERRNGGQRTVNNIRICHAECNKARDDHYKFEFSKTLLHLQAIGDLATCLNRCGFQWNFSDIPNNEQYNYEVTLYCNPIELDFCQNLLGKIFGLLSSKYGTFYDLKLIIDKNAPTRFSKNNIIDHDNDFLNLHSKDLLRQAYEMIRKKYKKSQLNVVLRHALWTHLQSAEPEIYKKIASKGKLTHD
jgi:hypothetical protein